ncbi:MAG: hypothetical protein ACOX69_05585 [Coriobacteriales bacterium]|jgi:hypothetical protein
MQLTLCKHSALRQLRAMRKNGSAPSAIRKRCDLLDPDPSPRSRWTPKRFQSLELPLPLKDDKHLELAVSHQRLRPKCKMASSKVYGTGLPAGAFIRIGSGLAISSPELVFVELANDLTLPEHLLLGFELCGGYALDPENPNGGGATMNVAPVTSVEKLDDFASQAKGIAGVNRARQTVRLLSDDAWSPMEAVIATMFALPLQQNGYGIGPCILNERHETPTKLRNTTRRSSRVPDIIIPHTNVGINYDGEGHLDLNSIVEATRSFDANPGSSSADRELRQSMDTVRAKVVDDVKRNRELAAQGLTVFPVVKEDLYRQGGLDALVAQVVSAIEAYTSTHLELQREILASEFAARERQQLVWSLLPGSNGKLADTNIDDAIVRM